MKKLQSKLTLCCVGLLSALALSPITVQAADHTDPPAVSVNPAADIADFYAYHRGTGASQTLVTVLTFAGLQAPMAGQTGTYDPNVLYAIHIDNDGDNKPNTTIYARFGKNRNDQWGIQVINLPGEAGPLVGEVEKTIDGTNSKVFAGLRDDPFFFDLQGFQTTLTTMTLSFDPTRDSFKGTNVTAIVLEMPMSAALGAGTSLQVWATTAIANN